MISLEDYFGPWLEHEDATDEVLANAETLLQKVAVVMEAAFEDGVDFEVNPNTNNYVAGKTLGGFRPQDATQGAATSSHKEGRGVDIYDPRNEMDEWCMANLAVLRSLGLYMEHPSATNRWCHLTDRAPRSGRVVFYP